MRDENQGRGTALAAARIRPLRRLPSLTADSTPTAESTPPADEFLDPTDLLPGSGLATLERLAESPSTMDRAREIAADPGARLPAAVIADCQTLGRGRRGARWWQPPGSLAVSLVVGPAAGPRHGPRPTWSLVCGIALAESIRELEPTVAATVRWPNDIEVAGRKLAGILVETSTTGRAVFGVGVNTTGRISDAPEGLRGRLVTIPDLTGQPLSRRRLLAAFIPRLLDLLAATDADPALLGRRYRPLCGLHGLHVQVFAGERHHTGICRGIADDGGLILDGAEGPVIIHAGSLTRPGDEWRGGDA